MRETKGIPQIRRSGHATRGCRDRPVPRNCWQWPRGSTRTQTDQEDPLMEMDFENPRPSKKTGGPPATGTRDRVPMLVDPRHDRREGAQLRPGMVNYDYTKCTQRLDRAHISNRWRCYHLVVAAPPGDREIEREVPLASLASTSWRKAGA